MKAFVLIHVDYNGAFDRPTVHKTLKAAQDAALLTVPAWVYPGEKWVKLGDYKWKLGNSTIYACES